MELSIDDLKKLCKDELMIMTNHASDRIRERGISFDDIKHTIMTGEIIEHYPNDFPNPSCLVLGASIKGRILHVVAGSNRENLWIITAYYPDNERWISNYKFRKENE